MSSRQSSGDMDPDVQGGTGPGWPNWLAALGLLAVVAVLLGGAFFLNARLRPQVGSQPVATAAPATVIAATPTFTPSPASAAAVGVASPASSPTAGGADAELAAVSQGYLHYWDVYANALLTLDTSHLSEVTTGDELARAQTFIAQLRAQHRAIRSDVTHHFDVTVLNPSAASVNDAFVDRGGLVDATTHQPVGTPEPASTETVGYRMELVGGVWKVARVVRINVTVVHQ